MLGLLWPRPCVGCGAPTPAVLCPSCQPGHPHRAPRPAGPLQGVVVLAGYDSPLGRAVRRGKTRPDRALLVRLAAQTAPHLARPFVGGGIRAVVPAPSTAPTRLRRGFSAASLLAQAMAAHLGVPCVDALSRRPGPRQASLSGPARRANLDGRLRAVRSLSGPVLLVDDVTTTGTTAASCGSVLRHAGAEGVWLGAWCAARRSRPVLRSRPHTPTRPVPALPPGLVLPPRSPSSRPPHSSPRPPQSFPRPPA